MTYQILPHAPSHQDHPTPSERKKITKLVQLETRHNKNIYYCLYNKSWREKSKEIKTTATLKIISNDSVARMTIERLSQVRL